MENKKVFIGNLNFEVTESDVRELLSKYGTVVSVKMHKKKGYAFIEMEDANDAAKAVRKLDGFMHKNRAINASLALKAGKAKSLTVKKYMERGASISREKSGGVNDNRSRSEKYRDTAKSGIRPNDKNRNSGSSYGKPSNSSNNKSSDEFRKERPGLPSPERDRWATERPDDYRRPSKKVWSEEKPSYTSRQSRDGERGRPVRDNTKERPGAPRPEKREWTAEKPLRSYGKTDDSLRKISEKNDSSNNKSRDYSKPRPVSGSQNRFSKSSKPKSSDAGVKSSSGTSRPKPRSRAINKDSSRRPK
jgi:hypothetical protein